MTTSSGTSTMSCCVLTAPLDEAQADQLARRLKALADPVRLRLVSLIAGAPAVCACDLPAAVDRAQPTVSHHLGQLVAAGIIEREQRGKWAWFRLVPGQLDMIRAALGETAEHATSDSIGADAT
ncbi:MAG TPA: metalloregulator ArsR/SmtB family transcription factor [Ilumatobacter sp.]